MTVLEYKDIEVVINFKPFTIKAALGDDGWARIPFKSLPYPGLPQLLLTPFVKVMNDRCFEEAVNDYLKEQGREGAVEGRS